MAWLPVLQFFVMQMSYLLVSASLACMLAHVLSGAISGALDTLQSLWCAGASSGVAHAFINPLHFYTIGV